MPPDENEALSGPVLYFQACHRKQEKTRKPDVTSWFTQRLEVEGIIGPVWRTFLVQSLYSLTMHFLGSAVLVY